MEFCKKHSHYKCSICPPPLSAQALEEAFNKHRHVLQASKCMSQGLELLGVSNQGVFLRLIMEDLGLRDK